MRSLTMKLVLILALALTLADAALALTLDQGIYRLQWKVSNSMEDPRSYASGLLTAMSEEAAKSYQGLCSAKCVSGEVGQFLVILDQSKGTGKHYDTAYLLPKKSNQTDLSKAVKLSLKVDRGYLTSEEETIDIQLGEGESRVTKQVAISLTAYGDEEGEGKIDSIFIEMALGGCWTGTIGSDAGPMDIVLLDGNSNGVYGDFVNLGEDGFPERGDGIWIWKKNTDPRKGAELIYLSRVVFYGNKLYTMKASKLGDTLEIRPYTGGTGKLKFTAKDASGKPLQCQEAYVFSDNGVYKVDTGLAAALPPGTYKCPYVTVMTPAKSKKTPFGFAIQPKSAIKISANKESAIQLGGPIKVAIEPGSKEITARQGQRKQINLEFYAGSDKLRDFTDDREATVTIKDSRGKQIWSGTAGFG